MVTDAQSLARQFRGRRLAALVLSHVDNQSPEQCKAAAAGLCDELPAELRQPVLGLIDFSLAMPQDQQASFFAGDCGERFLELMDVIKGYLFKNHQLQVTQDDAFTIFNILVVNFALCCHAYPQTKAAMKKAAGVGFLGRLFGG